MESVEIETLVVGAGVIGLAAAAALARRGEEVFVIDRAKYIGDGISSRNSEVIHSGIYYPYGSLKHQTCIEGRDRLYRYCAERDIAHRRCGKIVVATNEQERDKLQSVHAQAERNGVTAVRHIDCSELASLEPRVSGVAALFCEDTGIIDSHSYLLALRWEIEAAGGQVLLNHRVVGGHISDSAKLLEVETPDGLLCLKARRIILAAGPWTHTILSLLEAPVLPSIPLFRLAKGSYFTCNTRLGIRHLIYPVPVDGGLGTHLTLDIGGGVRFGPDVEWLESADPDKVDFNVSRAREADFYDAIRRYLPDLPDGSLQPAYSGVRPKLSGTGEAAADFRVDGPAELGVDGAVVLYGIESPGLTASLALAEMVADRLVA